MRYEDDRLMSFRIDDEGNRELMANFLAEIIEETRYVDGMNSTTVLTISGQQPNPDEDAYVQGKPLEKAPVNLPPLRVDASEFGSMSWVLPNWGVRAVIRPGTSIKDDLRTFIQLRSKPKIVTIYRHTGWVEIGRKRVYLHAGGGIRESGNDKSIRVQLSQELSRYDLSSEPDPKEAVKATLALARLSPQRPDVGWPLIAATLAPLYGQVDFALHVTGRTGTFKSEVMSLFQAHYGPTMDARHLPGSWSSTANALEAQAYFAKDAAFVVDDFVPAGTSWQVRAYQQTADKLIRAQGNQSGRARLSDNASIQSTMYPRGIVLSTGEDTPEGHSVRARMLILELSPGDIPTEKLTPAQKARPLYCGTVAALARSLAKEPVDLGPLVETLRTKYLKIGHTRTPSMLARLVATVTHFLQWCLDEGHLDKKEASKLAKEAQAAIEQAGAYQQQYLEDADPADQFKAVLRQVLGSGGGHLRTLNGGIPLNAELLGWTKERASGELDTFKSRGPLIGWVNWNADELYIDVTTGYNVIRKAAGSDMPLTKQTMFKRLKDAGYLVRADEARQRNTVRVTAEGHPRQVVTLSLSATLDMKEVPQ